MSEITSITLRLPIPAAALSPNARRLWHQKCGPVRDARLFAKLVATDALNLLKVWEPPRWVKAETRATFYYPSVRRRDGDNSMASLKATFDGFADAGLIANDSGFIHHPPVLLVDKSDPHVIVQISEVAE